MSRPEGYLGDHRFSFLNEERVVRPEDFGVPKTGLLWDYNFHYFDGLGHGARSEVQDSDWLSTWLANVPVGSSPAWDPYPLSRRLQNWARWVATQARHLERVLEYHLMANHLLTNAMALLAAGAVFGGLRGDRWQRVGRGLLERELEEQFLGDGGHFELSPTYHALLLADLMDLVEVCRRQEVEMPGAVPDVVRRGCRWMNVMTRSDGSVPLFNDAAYDAAPSASALGDHASELGLCSQPHRDDGFHWLRESGYFRYTSGRFDLVADVGAPGPSYQPGHAHCDMLTFDVCWDERPVVVDTGTSTYEPGPRRSLERGTAAHNTVQVGEYEQSETWAAFRLARRGRVVASRPTDSGFQATVRAFPNAWTTLQRTWDWNAEECRVLDRVIEGLGHGGTCRARLHFHPGIELTGCEQAWRADGLSIGFRGAKSVRAVDFEYAPEFNRRVSSTCLEIEFVDELETTFGG